MTLTATQSREVIDGRECIVTRVANKIIREDYFNYGVDKLSQKGYYCDGSVLFEIYSDSSNISNFPHRTNGPTEIKYISLEKEFFGFSFFGRG